MGFKMDSPIGRNIKKHRKLQGITQDELAKRSNVSVMSIRRYESGERIPNENTIERIAKALKVRPVDLRAKSIEDLVKSGAISDEEYFDIMGFFSSQVERTEMYKKIILVDLDSMNENGQRKAMQHVHDLAKIPEYMKGEAPLSENAQAVEPPQSTGETPTPDAEKNGGEEE